MLRRWNRNFQTFHLRKCTRGTREAREAADDPSTSHMVLALWCSQYAARGRTCFPISKHLCCFFHEKVQVAIMPKACPSRKDLRMGHEIAGEPWRKHSDPIQAQAWLGFLAPALFGKNSEFLIGLAQHWEIGGSDFRRSRNGFNI
jgi:hypothetical protein